MAEKDDIAEDAKNQDAEASEDGEQGKKGLSTALLIKVAIGLAVLLIVLAVALFFFKSAEPEAQKEDTEVTQAVQTDANDDTADSELASTSDNEKPTTEPDTSMQSSTAEKALTQILELQQEIKALEAENQELNQEIEDLTTENKDLNKEIEIYNQGMSSADVPLEQLVRSPALPRDYRRNDYANTPKFELEPKWGDFETLTKRN